MKSSSIFVDDREVALGRRIGKGGEGEVYLADGENGLAVKLYTVADKAAREQKIVAMIRAGLAKKSPLTAFPLALARARNGDFVGFTMRLVPDHLPLHELYSPGSRKQKFPYANFQFLVHTAANISRAIASVHNAGCVIGDINHSSILISKKATVALIDADSFQVSEGSERFYCVVGVPEYTPPELQCMKLSQILRTPNHDAFGLAVVVFQLLFMGRHPFSGSPRKGDPLSFEEAIRDFRFAYTEKRDVGMDQPPATPVLSDFPADVAQSFERAFSREHSANRPGAMDWVRTLDALEKSLIQCDKIKLHYFAPEAVDCPWCEMEERLGTVLFVPYVPAARFDTQPIDIGAGGFDIDTVWLKISRIGEMVSYIPTIPALSAVAVAPSVELKKATNRFAAIFWLRIAAVCIASVVMFKAPEHWVVWLGLALLAVFSGGGKVRRTVDPTPFLKHYYDLERRWQAELAAWQSRCGLNDLIALRTALENAKAEYKRLPGEERRRMAFYQSVRKTRQQHAFLDGFLITNSRIKGIGPAKVATLASFGIESAADITMEKLQGVPGFGPVNSGNLMAWRSKMEARFVYRELPTDSDNQELARINAEMQAKGSQLRKLLIPGAENLSRLVARLKAASAIEDPTLKRLYHELEQAKCNLAFLKLPLPPVPAAGGSCPITASATPSSQGSHTGTACPRCGSGMVRRTAHQGPRAGSGFWGCSRFPLCRGTRN